MASNTSPLSMPLPPSPTSPIQAPKGRLRKRRASLTDSQSRPLAYEAMKNSEEAAGAAADAAVTVATRHSEQPKHQPVHVPAVVDDGPGDQGNMPSSEFGSRYLSLRVAPPKPIDVTALQRKLGTCMVQAQQAERDTMSTKVKFLWHQAQTCHEVRFQGVLQKRAAKFPFDFEDAEFEVADGHMKWMPVSKSTASAPLSLSQQASMMYDQLAYLSSSGSVPISDVVAPKKLPMFVIPRHTYSPAGESATLGVCGVDYELRGPRYRLEALGAAVTKQQAASQKIEELKAAQREEREFRSASRVDDTIPSAMTNSSAQADSTASDVFLGAVTRNDWVQVRDYLDHGADVHMTDGQGLTTALKIAVKYGDSHLPTTRLLLQQGALPDTLSAFSDVLAIAQQHRNVKTVELLNSKGKAKGLL